MDGNWTKSEREQLEQELLELHFDCHPAPDALRARLLAEPALRALQTEVVATATLLRTAAQPAQAPLRLTEPATPVRWWRRPVRRLAAVAAAALVLVGAFSLRHGFASWRLHATEHSQCQLTVSAPRAVPAGAPWSFTLQSQDSNGEPLPTEVRWRVLDAAEHEIAAGTTTANGNSSIAMAAGMALPHRLEVAPVAVGGPSKQTLTFETSAAPPLVHVATDKPVYRPGEPVFVRAVVLDRCTLQPSPLAQRLQVTIRDAKGGLAFQQNGIGVSAPLGESGVGACTWQVPPESAGGEHTVEVTTWDQALPIERQTFVVRAFAAPRLQKDIVLDRKTYAPGERGSAEVAVQRLGGDVAAGANARGSLLLDGDEVWHEDKVLDDRGKATFRFAVPAAVRQGAARFVASISDGGVVETEVKPFVVPTGEVLAVAYPEGGELVAGVENRVYVELTDPLGRPIEGAGVVETERGERVAEFVTAHQGRARCAFTPEAGATYRLRATGMKAPLRLPMAAEEGIALQAIGDGIAAGAPVRVHLGGRGNGPWLVGAFCRGVLLGQTTVQPDARGGIDGDVAIALPTTVAGVLRVTVFDRTLQPVAERLVQRQAAEGVRLAIEPLHAIVAPGGGQEVGVRATDEHGRPIAGALVGLSVTDGSALAMGTEPRVGLLDQLLLFADCERLEDLGQFAVGDAQQARNVDLVLGTRGWRRFVWRNDDAAKAAIAKATEWGKDQLLREGFAQQPQVASNRSEVLAALVAPQTAAFASERDLGSAAGMGIALLLAGLLVEFVLWALRQAPVLKFVSLGSLASVAVAAMLQMPALLGAREVADMKVAAAFAPDAAQVAQFGLPRAIEDNMLAMGAAAALGEVRRGGIGGQQRGLRLPFDLGAGGWDDRLLHRVHRFAEIDEEEVPQVEARLEQVKWGRLDDRREQAMPAREYSHHRTSGAARTDFTDTICWQPLLVTDGDGRATAGFDTSDAVTTWHVRADAHGAGRVGQAEATFAARLPFHAEAKLPVEVSAGDHLLVPVALERTLGDAKTASLDASVDGPLTLRGERHVEVALVDGRGRALLPIDVQADVGTATVAIKTSCGGFTDDIRQPLAVVPRGFPHRRSSGGKLTVGTPTEVLVALPADSMRGSGHLLLRVFPSPLAGMTQGLQGLLREPCGCFEQASSTNYPNVMVLSYLQACGDDVPAVAARARELLPHGYQRIVGYECKERGYEWFGGDPGHEALTAYGLLEFHDMQPVFDVDGAMLQRTAAWLLARRDGKGGYQRNDRALDSFGHAPQPITDAYVTFALLEAGTAASELQREIDAAAARAVATDDAYELALCAGALGRAQHAGAATARQRLLNMQQQDGSLRGSTSSITSSGGADLAVETTAWATMAWLQDKAFAGAVRKACAFLEQQRSASGTFGATQATICALRALTAYAQQNRAMQAAGKVAVFAGQKQLAERAFAAGQAEPVDFDLWSLLPPGEHTLRLELASEAGVELPWALDVSYHSELPADEPSAAIGIATRLLQDKVAEGSTVALEVAVMNRTQQGQPMTIALVGLPAGLELPTRVLEDRKRAGDFDLWELKGRELALYWRSLAPAAERRVQLDLVAAIPGTTTGAASRAYLYYTAERKRWATPLQIEVTPR